MNEVTRILSQIESGDPSAAEALLPLVYDELRKLASVKLAHEKPGQTLQATALVHDAFIRLVDIDKLQHWDSRGHFFAAAAEAMRRILVDQARRKHGPKAGGRHQRIELSGIDPEIRSPDYDILTLNEAGTDGVDEYMSQLASSLPNAPISVCKNLSTPLPSRARFAEDQSIDLVLSDDELIDSLHAIAMCFLPLAPFRGEGVGG